MTTEQTQKRRTPRNPRRTFTVAEQLRGKLGEDGFSLLEGKMQLRTARPRPKRAQRGRGRKS